MLRLLLCEQRLNVHSGDVPRAQSTCQFQDVLSVFLTLHGTFETCVLATALSSGAIYAGSSCCALIFHHRTEHCAHAACPTAYACARALGEHDIGAGPVELILEEDLEYMAFLVLGGEPRLALQAAIERLAMNAPKPWTDDALATGGT